MLVNKEKEKAENITIWVSRNQAHQYYYWKSKEVYVVPFFFVIATIVTTIILKVIITSSKSQWIELNPVGLSNEERNQIRTHQIPFWFFGERRRPM